MIDDEEVPAARARLDEVRQRLYRPDASEEDRSEYADLQARLAEVDRAPLVEEPPQAEQEAPEEDPEPARRPRRSRVLIAVGAVAVLVLAVVIGVSVSQGSRSSALPARPTTQAVDGGASASAPAAVSEAPTLAPTAVPMLDEGTAVIAQQAYGGGSAIVPLDTSSAPKNGELIVSLSSSDPAPVGWRAERHEQRANHTSYLQVVAASDPSLRQGTVSPNRTGYTGAAPSQVVIDAPTGVGWQLVVEFLPMGTNGLR